MFLSAIIEISAALIFASFVSRIFVAASPFKSLAAKKTSPCQVETM